MANTAARLASGHTPRRTRRSPRAVAPDRGPAAHCRREPIDALASQSTHTAVTTHRASADPARPTESRPRRPLPAGIGAEATCWRPSRRRLASGTRPPRHPGDLPHPQGAQDGLHRPTTPYLLRQAGQANTYPARGRRPWRSHQLRRPGPRGAGGTPGFPRAAPAPATQPAPDRPPRRTPAPRQHVAPLSPRPAQGWPPTSTTEPDAGRTPPTRTYSSTTKRPTTHESTYKWINKVLGLRAQTVREDRIRNEVQATAGDVRRVCDMFGLSIDAALRYTDTLNHSTSSGVPTHSPHRGGEARVARAAARGHALAPRRDVSDCSRPAAWPAPGRRCREPPALTSLACAGETR